MNQPGRLPVRIHDPRIQELSTDSAGSAGWLRLPDGSVRLTADPLGTQPFCWRFLGNTLHLACFPGDLARLEPYPPVNLPVVRGLLRHVYPDDGASHFSGVRRVVAGHQVRVSMSGEGTESRWWQLPPEPAGHTAPQLWDSLVKQCDTMIGSRQSAVLLSGGLDSSGVAAAAGAAARASGAPPPFLASIVYPGNRANEDEWQQAVADHLGLERITIDPMNQSVWPGAQAVIEERLSPFVDMQSAAMRQLFAALEHRGCSVVLNGLGGDVLFRGVGLELSLARRGNLAGIHRHFAGLAEAMPVSIPRLWWSSVVRPLLTRHRSPGMSDEEIAAAGSSVRSLLVHVLKQSAFGWLFETVIQAAAGDRFLLESPFYGAGFLAEFARVSEREYLASRSHKGILRELIRPHLPASVVDRRPKVNFREYHRTWVSRERESLVRRYRELRSEGLPDLGGPADLASSLVTDGSTPGFVLPWLALCGLEFLSVSASRGHAMA
ncbi:MAG: asparagine synthase-related protein [Gemmatimonadota bacterium]